jgi:hypothetical protein
MRNQLLLRALLLLTLSVAMASPSSAVPPDWVPEQYREYFHRSAGNTQGWETALDHLGMQFTNVGGSFALIVGVSTYPRMSGRAADLWPARVDVEKMVSYVEGPPESFDEVVVLLDEAVTSENLAYFLTQYFPRRLEERPGSRFLFTYSGHGMTESNDRGYLLTSQAQSLTDRWASIPMFTVRAQLQEIVDSGFQVLALINSCYSSDFHRMIKFGEDDKELRPPVRPNEPGAHVITAGGTGELTWHNPQFGVGDGPKGSVFFEAVIAALEGRADKIPSDGIVSVDELEAYVKNVVPQFTDKRQHPMGDDLINEGSLGGFFFFDRATMVSAGLADRLEGEWWSALAFGGTNDDETDEVDPPERTASAGASDLNIPLDPNAEPRDHGVQPQFSFPGSYRQSCSEDVTLPSSTGPATSLSVLNNTGRSLVGWLLVPPNGLREEGPWEPGEQWIIRTTEGQVYEFQDRETGDCVALVIAGSDDNEHQTIILD